MAYDENIKKLLISLYNGGKSPEEISKFLSNLRTKTDYDKIKDISTSLGLQFNQLDWAVLVKHGVSPKTIRRWISNSHIGLPKTQKSLQELYPNSSRIEQEVSNLSILYRSKLPPSLGQSFVGTKFINELDLLFYQFRAVVISGSTGYGKTRLVAEYVHRAQSKAIWTKGRETTALTLSELTNSLESNEQTAVAAKRRNIRLPSNLIWVIDDLPDLNQVNELLGFIGDVRLLITTRDGRRVVLSPIVGFLNLDTLEVDDAVKLLDSRSQKFGEHPDLPKIAEKVGYLPLALEILSIRLAEPRQTPDLLLKQLEQAPTPIELEVFKDPLGITIPRGEGVYSTITGIIAQVPEDLRRKLDSLGYVADAPIPEKLGMDLMGISDSEVIECWKLLSKQSIFQWTNDEIRVHPLTIAAIAATNPPNALYNTLIRATSRISLDEVKEGHPLALKAELVHYQSILNKAQKSLGKDHPDVLRFAYHLDEAAVRNEDAERLEADKLLESD